MSAALSHLSSLSFILGVDKGGNFPVVSVHQAVFFVRAILTMKLSAKAFPCYFKGFAQFCVKIPYTSGESHCIKFHGLVDKFTLK